MTIDEYAHYEKGNKARIQKVDNIWWREVRPFFFRPLFPFIRILPGSAKPPFKSIIGGIQHLVPTNCDGANSFINLLVFDDIQNYSMDKLTHDYRKNVKKGLKYFTVKPIDNFEKFAMEGHKAYLSFYERTSYKWGKKRKDRRLFERWAQNLFDFRKIKILGAYRNVELCAVGISYLVEDVIIYATFFSNTESLKLRVSEVMLHTIRETAAECNDVKYIYMGPSNTKASLNDFKISRGCKVMSEAAFFQINPFILLLGRQFRKKDYRKLIGKDGPQPLNQEE